MKPEGRAIAVAELLRQGYTGTQVSQMLAVTDRGGSLQEAMEALRDSNAEHLSTEGAAGVSRPMKGQGQ